MSPNIFGDVLVSDNGFLNIGDTYQSGDTVHEKLLNRLLPNSQSNQSLGIYWDHNQARQRCLKGTGAWLHDDAIFKSWLAEPNSFLWLRGIAGSGKTVLSSTVIDYLRDSPKGNNSTAGYYFNAREDEKRNVSRLIRSLLLQLCPVKGILPLQVQQLQNTQDISDDKLFETFKNLVTIKEQTYIIIDALDECDMSFQSSKEAEDEKLAKFIRWLTDLKAPNLHVLVTSRSSTLGCILDNRLNGIVDQGLDDGFFRSTLDLQAEAVKINVDGDINRFIDSELTRWNDRRGRPWLPLDDGRRELIAKPIKDRANGMFRLAACLLDLLYRKNNWGAVEGALGDMPSELTEVYDRIFEDIKTQGRFETANILLQWLLYSERSLDLRELTELVMVDSEGDIFDIGRLPKDQSYVSLTLSSFVTISEDNLVQLAHETVKEYLLGTTEQGVFSRKIDCNVFLAKCCLSYMQFCDRSDLECISASSSERQFPEDYALLEYVFNNWYLHAMSASEDITKTYPLTYPKFSSERPAMDERNGHNPVLETSIGSISEWATSIKLWLEQINDIECDSYHNTLAAFACEAYGKFVELFPAKTIRNILIDKQKSINAFTDILYGEHQSLVRLILGVSHLRKISWPKKLDARYILLHKSYEEILRFLIGNGLDLTYLDNQNRTVLHKAVLQENETITKLLIEKGVAINTKDANGQTALHIASSEGCHVLTALLLENKASASTKDSLGRTPLDVAVYRATVDLGHKRREDFKIAQSNHETIARTIRLLLKSESKTDEIHDSEALETASEVLSKPARPSQIDGVFEYGETTRPAISMFKKKMLDEQITDSGSFDRGSIHYGMPLIQQLSEFGCFTTFRLVVPVGVLRIYKSLIDSTIHGTPVTLFRTTRIERLELYESTTFPGIIEVEDLVIYTGSTTFLGTVRVQRHIDIRGGCGNFSGTTQVQRGIYIDGGCGNFLGTTQVQGDIDIDGGCGNFSGIFRVQRDIRLVGGYGNFLGTTRVQGGIYIDGGCGKFSGTTQVQKDIFIHGGYGNFLGTVRVQRDIHLVGGCGNFPGTIQVQGDIDIYGGCGNFPGKTQVQGDIRLVRGCGDFSRTTQVRRSIYIDGGCGNFLGTTQVQRGIYIDGGYGNFSGTTKVRKDIFIHRGYGNLLGTGRIEMIKAYGGNVNFLSSTQIKCMDVRGATVNFMHETYEEMLKLIYGKDVTGKGRGNCERSMTQIEVLKIEGGTVNFSVDGRIGVMEVSGGVANVHIGMAALHIAVAYGHDAIAGLLLEKGADPNTITRSSEGNHNEDQPWKRAKWTALHIAAYIGRKEAVQLLLDHQADVDMVDDNGRTALQIAASQGHTEVVRLLKSTILQGCELLRVRHGACFSLR